MVVGQGTARATSVGPLPAQPLRVGAKAGGRTRQHVASVVRFSPLAVQKVGSVERTSDA